MALISGTIPSLINGISQQPATLRLPTQGEVQENGLSHIARGLEKRPCTEHITKIAGVTSINSDDVFIHTIRRSEDEAYALIMKGTPSSGTPEIKVIDLTGFATGTAGNEVHVRATADGVSGSSIPLNTIAFTAVAATDVITTSSTHGLVKDNTVILTTTTTLPAGLAVETTYFVLTTPTTSTLTLSAAKDGTVINITNTGTGTHTLSSMSVQRDYLNNFTAATNTFSPHSLSATTIADYTFILNKTMVIKQKDTLPDVRP